MSLSDFMIIDFDSTTKTFNKKNMENSLLTKWNVDW